MLGVNPSRSAFLADFRSPGRQRSSDRLTFTRTKIHQELLRALPMDLRRTYLDSGVDIARHWIKPSRIEQHWDDMLHVAGSLKLGTVHVSELVRSLLKSDRPSSLAQAIIELGRLNRTICLLNYIDDQEYRRRILTQLNRGEARHKVSRMICYDKRGEIRKAYREGQENQLNALGLVTSAIVLWNTIYM